MKTLNKFNQIFSMVNKVKNSLSLGGNDYGTIVTPAMLRKNAAKTLGDARKILIEKKINVNYMDSIMNVKPVTVYWQKYYLHIADLHEALNPTTKEGKSGKIVGHDYVKYAKNLKTNQIDVRIYKTLPANSTVGDWLRALDGLAMNFHESLFFYGITKRGNNYFISYGR